MANYDYSSHSSSSASGGGAGGFDVAKAIFNQADANQDGSIDKEEFQQWVRSAGSAGGAGGAGHFDLSGAGGAGANFGSSSYESSSYSSTGGAGGDFGAAGSFGADAGAAGASSFESSSFAAGAGFDAGAAGGSNFQSSSSFESGSAGAGYDVTTVSQAASYTAETNAAWSQYGAEVRGAGLYVDANPQIIRRPAAGGIQTYTQNIKVRFLQPPPVPPPGVSDIFVLFGFVFIIIVFL
jgi:hypothetical protein